MTYSVAIAGSTTHTVICAKSLLADTRFRISWILTPAPKVIGRQQVLTKNPLHLFAEENHLPVILIDGKIDSTVREKISAAEQPDFLLVVDFGYLIPKWLLELPTIAPLNIHPSLLPRWRGSSPGQFVLLYGEKQSAISIIIMDEKLDSGPLLYQEFFDVDQSWTQKEYYHFSFEKIANVLAEKMADFAEKKIIPTAQPTDSSTPLARRFTKDDGFVSWALIQNKQANASPLLQEVFQKLHSWPHVLMNATRALSPWPTLWTIIPTTKGEKRMQIIKSRVNDKNQFILDVVKIEGQNELPWSVARNQVA